MQVRHDDIRLTRKSQDFQVSNLNLPKPDYLAKKFDPKCPKKYFVVFLTEGQMVGQDEAAKEAMNGNVCVNKSKGSSSVATVQEAAIIVEHGLFVLGVLRSKRPGWWIAPAMVQCHREYILPTVEFTSIVDRQTAPVSRSFR